MEGKLELMVGSRVRFKLGDMVEFLPRARSLEILRIRKQVRKVESGKGSEMDNFRRTLSNLVEQRW